MGALSAYCGNNDLKILLRFTSNVIIHQDLKNEKGEIENHSISVIIFMY